MPTSGRRGRSTGDPHPLSRRRSGRAAPLSARRDGANPEDPDPLPDEAGGASAGALGRAGNLGLDLEGGGRGGRADPGAAAVSRRRRPDLLHDVPPAPDGPPSPAGLYL